MIIENPTQYTMNELEREQYHEDCIKDTIDTMNQSEYLVIFDNGLPSKKVKDLIKRDTLEYYLIASMQHSVMPVKPETKLLDILSPTGLELYRQTEEKVKNGEHKDTIFDYQIDRSRSGSWFSDELSPYHGTWYEDGTAGILCSWQNVQVFGKTEATAKEGKFIETSQCVLVVPGTDENNGWCLTQSGSIYVLQGKPKE